MRILENSIICKNCKEKLISNHVHDFKMCSCKQCGCDGGSFYLRRVGINYEDTSVMDKAVHSHTRMWLKWGVNYYKNGRERKETKWTKIKDLDTEHIWNILRLNIENKLYLQTFIDEIIYRENEYYSRNGISAINEIS